MSAASRGGDGGVTVTNATVSDQGVQFIGHTTIGTFNYGPSKDEKAQRHWEDVLRWLSPSDEALQLQQFIHDEARVNHKLEDAGSWFVDGKPFNNWIEGKSRLTWLNGGMGCGKTTLFFLAVERVRALCRMDPTKKLGYFYCTSRAPLGQSTAVLFRTLLRHLCSRSEIPTATQRLYELCDQGLDRRAPTVRELATALKDLVSCHSQAKEPASLPETYYLLIDGLDELEDLALSGLIQELGLLLAGNLPNVHVLVTSRNQSQIEAYLQGTVTWTSLPVDTGSVEGDIRSFVLSEIQAHRHLQKLPKATHEAILARVVDQSNGMFRWAFLQIQSLKALQKPVTPKKVERELERLPDTLDKTYDKMLNALDVYDKPRARRALMWLLFSARQLYIEELIDACAIDIEADTILEDKYDPDDIEALLQDLVLIQPPLPKHVESIEPETHVVMLVHASIREFLLTSRSGDEDSYFALQERPSHNAMARDCLAYLLCYNTYELRHFHEEYVLRRYAWYHWEDHVEVPPEPCVPTIKAATLRRRARRLFAQVKHYIGNSTNGNGSSSRQRHDSEGLKEGESNVDYSPVLNIILDGLRNVANAQGMDIQGLKTALNVPFFHADYDNFCPMETPQMPSGDTEPVKSPIEQTRRFDRLSRVVTYQYRPLKDDTWIRLLEILPAVDPETTIYCRLFEAPIAKAPPYAALSYSWGYVGEFEVINIEGHKFSVLPSQLILLRSLRSRVEDKNPAVWMDALCINQHDLYERNHQVSIIARVFSMAREVVVGLSNGRDSDNVAVHHFANLATALSLVNQPNASEEARTTAKEAVLALERNALWPLVLRIFDNAWWTRAWIIQEITLAPRAVILFGSMSFSFDLVEQVMLAEGFIVDVLRDAESDCLAYVKTNTGWNRARELVDARAEHRRGICFELPRLLWRFRHAQTLDKRDIVFALFGLLPPEAIQELRIDYTESVTSLVLRTSRWIMKVYKTLDILLVRSAFHVDEDYLPNSWSLPIAARTNGRMPLYLGIFAAEATRNIFSAAGDAKRAVVRRTEDNSILSSWGLTIERVARVIRLDGDLSPRSLRILCSSISHSQASLSSTDSRLQKTVEARWRTILANQWPLGHKLTQAAFRGIPVPPRTLKEEDDLLNVLVPDLDIPQIIGRVVIISKGGHLGLASDEVLPGDTIAIMPGSALPLMLRPEDHGYYSFICECYLHECVNGEAVPSMAEPGTDWWKEIFNII